MQTATTTRRFEFIAGKSSKFWEITVDGSNVLVCFGRIGANGQTSKKTFADGVRAEQHAEKQVLEKVRKGYAEVK
jgi:predicted DNA-binding WGR domain protein